MSLHARTLKNIATLDPKAQDAFVLFATIAAKVAAEHGCEYIMIGGNRTWKEQDALYAKGRSQPGGKVTNARGGYSNHMVNAALTQMGDGGELVSEDEHADMVAKKGLAGPGLPVWGKVWRKALARGRLALGRINVAALGLGACLGGNAGEVVGGRYGGFRASGLLQLAKRRQPC